MPMEIHTGAIPGRIVWGHPGKAQPKTDQQNKPILKADGSKIDVWSFGVAFDQAYFNQAIWPMLEAEAKSGYPNGTPPSFSWKLKDGVNGIDRQGKRYAEREGYAGCWIITVSTEAFAPPLLRWDMQTGQYQQMTPDQIKCGDYVALVLDVKLNIPSNASHTPGLYINPKAVIWVGSGVEIVPKSAFDPSTLPQMQYQLPPGVTQTPTVPMPAVGVPGAGMPGQPGMMPGQPQMQPQMQPGVPANPMMPGQPAAPGYPVAGWPVAGSPGVPMQQPQQQMMPAPAPDFVHGAPQGQPQMMPGQPMQQPQMQPGMPGQPMMQPGMPGQMPGMPGR